MLLPEDIGYLKKAQCKVWDNSLPPFELLLGDLRAPKLIQAIVSVLGYPQKLDGKTLLLKTITHSQYLERTNWYRGCTSLYHQAWLIILD